MLSFKNKTRLENVLTEYVCRSYSHTDEDGYCKFYIEDMKMALEFLAAMGRCPFECDLVDDHTEECKCNPADADDKDKNFTDVKRQIVLTPKRH